MEEIWKDVRGYEECYEVSNLGRVRTKKRILIRSNGRKFTVEPLIRSIHVGTSGYYSVNLRKNGKRHQKRVHILVAESFLNHVTCGYDLVVDHIDNNKLNNNVNNLQIITQRENSSKDKKGTSAYTGVCWHKIRCKWMSSITVKGRTVYLGYFDNEIDAHKAYQEALKQVTNKNK